MGGGGRGKPPYSWEKSPAGGAMLPSSGRQAQSQGGGLEAVAGHPRPGRLLRLACLVLPWGASAAGKATPEGPVEVNTVAAHRRSLPGPVRPAWSGLSDFHIQVAQPGRPACRGPAAGRPVAWRELG